MIQWYHRQRGQQAVSCGGIPSSSRDHVFCKPNILTDWPFAEVCQPLHAPSPSFSEPPTKKQHYYSDSHWDFSKDKKLFMGFLLEYYLQRIQLTGVNGEGMGREGDCGTTDRKVTKKANQVNGEKTPVSAHSP